MTSEKFIAEYLSKGLLKKQASNRRAVEALLSRAGKDLKAAEANLSIDENIAYTVAYLAMLHAGRAFMLYKGFLPDGGFQHKTVVEFSAHFLTGEDKVLAERFDKMRRKRNIFTYESDCSISRTEAVNAIEAATKFVRAVKELIG